jgi:FKBP-type peptidyl-prolyl cis-trans isomerase
MKIKSFKFGLCLMALVTVFISCGEDDDSPTAITFRDRAEQQVADKDSLLTYLSTHYYNSAFFETGSNHKYSDIQIVELEEGENVPDGNTLLIDAVETLTTEYLEVNYEYYILRINQGGGEAPRFTDLVRTRYEGSNVEFGDVFESISTPADLPLQGDGVTFFGSIKAWQLVLPSFNTAVEPPGGYSIVNGVVQYESFGLGVMFVPSGLAYFSSARPNIPAYSNLIFKFELLQYEEQDHDNDGIPSYLEDLDGDLDVSNDDTNGNGFQDFIDRDDDGDEVLTIDELVPTTYVVNTNMGESEPTLAANEFERSRSEINGVITINTVTAVDTDSNGIADYLDENVSINYNN